MEGNIDASVKSKDVNEPKEVEDEDLATDGVNSLPPLSKRKMRKCSDQTDDYGGNDATSAMGTLRRFKMLLPLSSFENDGSGSKEETRKSPSLGRKKSEGVTIEVDCGRSKELTDDKPVSTKRVGKIRRGDGEAKGQIEKLALSRERKKNKYLSGLSPPFSSLSWALGTQKESNRTMSIEVPSEARLGERLIRAAGQLVESPPIRKCDD